MIHRRVPFQWEGFFFFFTALLLEKNTCWEILSFSGRIFCNCWVRHRISRQLSFSLLAEISPIILPAWTPRSRWVRLAAAKWGLICKDPVKPVRISVSVWRRSVNRLQLPLDCWSYFPKLESCTVFSWVFIIFCSVKAILCRFLRSHEVVMSSVMETLFSPM